MTKYQKLFLVLASLAITILYQNCSEIRISPLSKNTISSLSNIPVVKYTENFLVGFAHNLTDASNQRYIELGTVDGLLPPNSNTKYTVNLPGPISNLAPYDMFFGFFDSDNFSDFSFSTDTYDTVQMRSLYTLHAYSGLTGSKIYSKYLGIERPVLVGSFGPEHRLEMVTYDYGKNEFQIVGLDTSNSDFREVLLTKSRIFKYTDNGTTHTLTPWIQYTVPDINNNGYKEILFNAYLPYANGVQKIITFLVDSKDLDFDNPLFIYKEDYPFQDSEMQACYDGNMNFCKYTNSINYANDTIYVTGTNSFKIYKKDASGFFLDKDIAYPTGLKPIRNDSKLEKNPIQFDQNNGSRILVTLTSYTESKYRSEVVWFNSNTNNFDNQLGTLIRTLTGCANCGISNSEVQVKHNRTYVLANIYSTGHGFHHLINVSEGGVAWKGNDYITGKKQLYLIREKE